MRQFDKSKLITVLCFAIFITCYVHNSYSANSTTWPISGTSFPRDINSDFGPRNFKDSPIHEGIDFNAKDHAEVRAVADGKVNRIQEKKKAPNGYGCNARIIKDGIYYVYAHLYDVKHLTYPVKVKDKDAVKKGDIIGYADNTGKSSGTHLHLTTFKIINSTVHKLNPLGLDIFNYAAKPPTIAKLDVKDEKGSVVSRLNIGNIYVDGKYEILKSIKGLKIEATVEDTEKDLNEVSYSATSTPAMDYSFIYPTSGFKAYTLKDGLMSKKGLPIKVKSGSIIGKEKSTDVFVLDWSIAGLKLKDFDLKDNSNSSPVSLEAQRSQKKLFCLSGDGDKPKS